jgi:hypothetical protein
MRTFDLRQIAKENQDIALLRDAQDFLGRVVHKLAAVDLPASKIDAEPSM